MGFIVEINRRALKPLHSCTVLLLGHIQYFADMWRMMQNIVIQLCWHVKNEVKYIVATYEEWSQNTLW